MRAIQCAILPPSASAFRQYPRNRPETALLCVSPPGGVSPHSRLPPTPLAGSWCVARGAAQRPHNRRETALWCVVPPPGVSSPCVGVGVGVGVGGALPQGAGQVGECGGSCGSDLQARRGACQVGCGWVLPAVYPLSIRCPTVLVSPPLYRRGTLGHYPFVATVHTVQDTVQDTRTLVLLECHPKGRKRGKPPTRGFVGPG